jgi:hypothetical protein
MEKHRIEIFTPRYEGDRFNEHRLPLDLIEDLSVFQEMAIEMAKVIYKERNQDRERIPKDFTKGISFELENIGEGSTIPKIVLITAMSGLFPQENVTYFEEAKDRIIEVVQSASDDTNINAHAPDSILKYFSRFGKKLGEDEFIEFNPNGEKKAKFTRESRKKIIKASSRANEYNEEVNLRGLISEIDFQKMSFTIDLPNGQRLVSPYIPDYQDVLKKSLFSFTELVKKKISIESTVRFNKTDNIIKIESVESIFELEDLDVPYRLEEISYLKNGWFDSESESFNMSHLQWLSTEFDDKFDPKLPLPNTYPTPDTNIQFEWSTENIEAELYVNLASKTGTLSILKIENDEEVTSELNLDSIEDWKKLNSMIESNII